MDWVEKDKPPGEITLTFRNDRVSYPVCVYPLRTIWNGSGPATQATSYSCR
jgi:feruloyl esterase